MLTVRLQQVPSWVLSEQELEEEELGQEQG
jgi:hypothetical protein